MEHEISQVLEYFFGGVYIIFSDSKYISQFFDTSYLVILVRICYTRYKTQIVSNLKLFFYYFLVNFHITYTYFFLILIVNWKNFIIHLKKILALKHVKLYSDQVLKISIRYLKSFLRKRRVRDHESVRFNIEKIQVSQLTKIEKILILKYKINKINYLFY